MLRAEEVLKGKCSQCETIGEQGLPVSIRINFLTCRSSLRGTGSRIEGINVGHPQIENPLL